MDTHEYVELINQWRTGQDFSGAFHSVANIKALNSIVATDYPAFDLKVPDVVRAQLFLRDLGKWEENGDMPNLIVMQLPGDHSVGNSPGWPTVKAMVADNDLALGKIVEGLTKSRFWPHMAIFVAEDDGINSLDHVDGRRIVALAISPYICHKAVDSTFYSQTSMVKTIELMLGAPQLTLFDRIATDMRAAFIRTPDLTPYQAETPQQSLADLNPPAQSLNGQQRKDAILSSSMDFSKPDAVKTEKFNRILWRSVRGWDAPNPKDHQAAFLPGGDGREDQDDDDEARKPANRNGRK